MSSTVASTVLILASGYTAIGALFAVAFVCLGLTRVDGRAVGAGLAFRAAVVPGLVLLWPLVLRLWIMAMRATPAGVDAPRSGSRVP